MKLAKLCTLVAAFSIASYNAFAQDYIYYMTPEDYAYEYVEDQDYKKVESSQYYDENISFYQDNLNYFDEPNKEDESNYWDKFNLYEAPKSELDISLDKATHGRCIYSRDLSFIDHDIEEHSIKGKYSASLSYITIENSVRPGQRIYFEVDQFAITPCPKTNSYTLENRILLAELKDGVRSMYPFPSVLAQTVSGPFYGRFKEVDPYDPNYSMLINIDRLYEEMDNGHRSYSSVLHETWKYFEFSFIDIKPHNGIPHVEYVSAAVVSAAAAASAGSAAGAGAGRGTYASTGAYAGAGGGASAYAGPGGGASAYAGPGGGAGAYAGPGGGAGAYAGAGGGAGAAGGGYNPQ